MSHSFQIKSFFDFDQFAHAIRAWDLDFRQMDQGDFKADLLQFSTSKSLLTYAQFNRRLDQRGSAPPGNWTFGILTKQSTPIIWHEQEVSNNTLFIYRPGSEIDCVSMPGFDVYTISYPEEYLNLVTEHLGLPEIKKLVRDYDCFECNVSNFFETHKQLHQISEVLKHRLQQIDYALLTKILDFRLTEQIILILSQSLPQKSISANLRTCSLKRIKEYLYEFPHEPVTVDFLCSITGVSRRTVQYAFQEHYGMSPKSYLKNFRLNGVRRELWKSDPLLTRVNDIASLWGFWHMGQFAADYRKLFGEQPSETLQRKK